MKRKNQKVNSRRQIKSDSILVVIVKRLVNVYSETYWALIVGWSAGSGLSFLFVRRA